MKNIDRQATVVRLVLAAAMLASFLGKMKTVGFHGGF